MSDAGGWSADAGAQRIGDAERAAAAAALESHREAGRLDASEYENRQVRVSRAQTWADVRPAFEDLPEPHPVGMPAPGAAVRPLAGQVVGGRPAQGEGLLGVVVPERYRTTVMALTPFAALGLFLATHWWVWFLAIPVMGILLYGADDNAERSRQERLARQERREQRRDRRRDR